MIKAAIFDMDGLLIDSEPLWLEVFQEVFKEMCDVKVTEKDMQQTRGRRIIESIKFLSEKYQVEKSNSEKIEERLYEGMKTQIHKHGKLLPGVHKTLKVCKDAGLPIAIASSSAMEIIDAAVEELEIREHFDHIYSARYEPYGKPHPGTFLKVAEHFKVDPEQCLVFEDAPNGVLAAKAANMRCVAVPEKSLRNHKFVQTADIILDSLEDFDRSVLMAL